SALRSYFMALFQDSKIRKGPVLSDYSLAGPGSVPGRATDPHDWFSEGDTPQFMQQFPFGLQDLNNYNPALGDWGGRFMQLGPHLWADNPSYLGYPQTKTVDYSPYADGRPFSATTLTQDASAGATTLKLASIANLAARDIVTVGTGATAEQAEIAGVGTG